jgi:hypothetical protein
MTYKEANELNAGDIIVCNSDTYNTLTLRRMYEVKYINHKTAELLIVLTKNDQDYPNAVILPHHAEIIHKHKTQAVAASRGRGLQLRR